MSRDPRWHKSRFIVLTLFAQLIFSIIIASLGFTTFDYGWIVFFPAPLALATILLNIVLLICFATGHLHPLVVLVFACEYMVSWVAATIFATVAFMSETDYRCGRGGSSRHDYGYNYYGYSRYAYESRDTVCAKGVAALVFDWFMLALYVWLVAYSAVVRKQTRMPYIRVAKDAEAGLSDKVVPSPRFSGVAYNSTTVPTSPVMQQQVPVVMSGGSTTTVPKTTAAAPVQQGTAV